MRQFQVTGDITLEVSKIALNKLEIDEIGLDETDRKMLKTMIEKYKGGPVGIETIAATIGEEAETIEDVYEPYLMQLGFLTRTPRGRCVTPKAYQHLGLTLPCGSEPLEQLSFQPILQEKIPSSPRNVNSYELMDKFRRFPKKISENN